MGPTGRVGGRAVVGLGVSRSNRRLCGCRWQWGAGAARAPPLCRLLARHLPHPATTPADGVPMEGG